MPPKRKSVAAPSATESTATPTKRMRNSVAATPASAPAAPQVEVTPQTGEKRGRGRPRKYPEGTIPKPPASDGPKRGRGRPRKVTAESEPEPEAEAATPSAPKRGRGRPRKETVTEPAATPEIKKKDGRGRPRKEPAPETPATSEKKKDGRGRPRKEPAVETPATSEKKKDGRGRPSKKPAPNGEPEAPEASKASDAKAVPAINNNVSDTNRSFWLMKAEPESRMEKGVDVKFSIDDLAAATVPEPWDGVRNHVARKSMQEMKKGDYAFFYHSNCKTPGVVGVMEIVQESSVDESAFDTAHPYYDAKSKREDPKWVVVHVEYRRKLGKQVTLAELKSNAQPGRPLENMQMLKQSRLSISSVTPAQWQYILELAGEEPQEEFTKVESGAEKA